MFCSRKKFLNKVLVGILAICIIVPVKPDLSIKVKAVTYTDSYTNIPVDDPTGIAVDSNDNLYVCSDTELYRYNSSHTLDRTWDDFGGDIFVRDVAVDRYDNIYVSAMSTGKIYKIDGNGVVNLFIDGVTADAIAADSSGNIFITDQNGGTVTKYDTNGLPVTSWGENGSLAVNYSPLGIAINSSDEIYVVSTLDYKVYKYNSEGSIITGWVDAVGADVGAYPMYYPNKIITDGNGDVYVTDISGYCVFKLSGTDGSYVKHWGVLNTSGTGDGMFESPQDVDLDSEGNIYVSEFGDNKIVLIEQVPAATPATDFTYTDNPDGTTATVTGYTGTDTNITIPSVNPSGKTVTKIGYGAFDSEAFTGVIIPNTITEIGAHAFIACRQLVGITIPDSVTTIGDAAFCYCDSLETVQLPAGLEIISSSAFEECYSLTDIALPATLRELGGQAFKGCDAFTSIVIPSGVNIMGSSVFKECENLETVNIPAGLTAMGSGCFASCPNLRNVTIEPGSRLLGDSTFYECPDLVNITIPDSVESIGSCVFYGTGITNINIPAALTTIADYALYGCPELTTITADAANPDYSSDDGILYNKNVTVLVQYPSGNTAAEFIVPDGVAAIGAGALGSPLHLTKVIVPSTVNDIGDYGFDTDSAIVASPVLTELYFKGTAPATGAEVFYGSSITVYCKAADRDSYTLTAGKWNGCTLLEWSEAAAGLTASVAPKAAPESGKVMLTVTPGASAGSHKIYYRVVSSDPAAMEVGDIISVSAWTEVMGTSAQEISAVNGNYIETVEIITSDSRVTKWGKSAATNDGYVPPVAATGMGTSVAPKLMPESGRIMLGVAPAASDANHKVYYRVVSSDPAGMYIGDVIDISAWVEVTGTDPQEIGAVNGSYIEAVEVTIADSRVTKWGKSAATNDGYVPPVAAAGLTAGVAPKSTPESGKVMLTVTPGASDGSHKIYYRVVSADPAAPNVGDIITAGSWTEVTGTGPQEISAVNGSYIEAVEITIADSRVTKWGKFAATNDGYVPLSVAAGITVSVLPKAIPESNKVVLAATSSAIVANSRLLYRVTASDPAAPNVGDTITISEWIPVIDTNAMEISAINGSYIEVVEITTADSKITQWGKSGRIADGYTAPPPLITPDAPTNPIQNDTNNTFGWTFVPGYNLISDYEYSLNGGSTWTAAAANPLNLSNQAYPAGTVQVRVKADSLSNRTAGLVLSSTIAYTVARSSDSNGGSNNSGTNPNPPPSPNTGGTIRQVEVKVGNDTSSTASSQVDIIRTTENNQKKDSVVLNDEKTDEVLKKAVEQNKDNVTIIINDVPDDKADEVSVSVTNSSIGKLANNNTSLEIKTEEVTIELPKETVRALSGREEDLYFRVVPVKDEAEKQEAVKNTIQASIVKDTADGDEVAVYGTPMTIETNYQNQTTKVTFSLKDIPIPAEPAAREEFLNNLAIFIQHSDGEEVLDRGTIKYDSLGNPVGIEIVLTKFSTFTIIAVGNVAPLAVNVAISGSTQVGKKLTARYTYSDIDNDPQGKSTIKWYRADSAKGKNKKVITGATKLTYTITEKDKGKFIIFEIIPKAKTGTIKGNVVTAATKTVIKKTTAKPANKKEEAKNSAQLKLGTVSDKKYADTLSDRLKNTYGGKNVAIVKEGKYYRVSANFADKTKAKAVAEDMKKKKLIINYSIK